MTRRVVAPGTLAGTLVGALAAVVALSACGGAQDTAKTGEGDAFKCRDRRIAYIATGHFAGPEVRVIVDCAERGPRISRRVLLDDNGGEQTGEHSLSAARFDELWEKIESTGWRNLDDCEDLEAGEGEPTYKFGIKDENDAVSLACTGKQLPFPFDRLLSELDLLVAEFSL